ncbi:4'-phosphopantetheinyl transferase superfamily protein [Streptomyces sp. NPDC001941]|uniref:4'-phosphopantetheinyl transferase family protein n=1 Tax=Streptomyces sp. NPDC001941 TaxID=3154659 RepID=UPI0033170C4C
MFPIEHPEVWLLRVPARGPGDGLLDAAERARLAVFARPRDRARYAFAHHALRTVLAARTGADPARLRFGRADCPCCGRPHGRPVLEGTEGAPQFSLSHRGDLVVIGVAAGPVGVDVEPEPAQATLTEVVPLLHPAERAVVEAAAPDGRAGAFARTWARKEAYLKGLGTGLGRSLALDDLTVDPPGWTVTELPAGPGAAAAVAVRGAGAPGGVRLWHALDQRPASPVS